MSREIASRHGGEGRKQIAGQQEYSGAGLLRSRLLAGRTVGRMRRGEIPTKVFAIITEVTNPETLPIPQAPEAVQLAPERFPSQEPGILAFGHPSLGEVARTTAIILREARTEYGYAMDNRGIHDAVTERIIQPETGLKQPITGSVAVDWDGARWVNHYFPEKEQ